MRWVSSAVRLVSGDTSPLPPRPAVEPAAVTSLIAAAALRLNEGEINQTTDDMSRVRLDHGGVEAYAEHAAGKLEAEHPKGAFENPSHDRVSARRRGNFVEALPIDRTFSMRSDDHRCQLQRRLRVPLFPPPSGDHDNAWPGRCPSPATRAPVRACQRREQYVAVTFAALPATRRVRLLLQHHSAVTHSRSKR